MAQESRSERRRPAGADALRAEPPVERAQKVVFTFPDPELTDIAESARSALNAAAIAIAVETGAEPGREIVCCARAGEAAPDLGAIVQPGHGITGECVAMHAVVRCEEIERDPRIDFAFSERFGIHSIVVVPLLRNGVAAGVIEAFFLARHAYTDASIESLEEFAKRIVALVYGPEEEIQPPPVTDDQALTPSVSSDLELKSAENAEPAPAAEAASEGQPEESKRGEGPDVPADIANTAPVFSYEEEAQAKNGRIRKLVPALVALAAFGVLATAVFILGRNAEKYVPRKPPANANTPATNGSRTPTDSNSALLSAAEAGDTTAQYALARAYRDGDGVPADPAKQISWLRRAASGGNADAQLELASTLEGREPADVVEAYTWYVIAGQAGKIESEAAIRRLTPQLSASDIAQVRLDVGDALASGHALPRDLVAAHVWYELAEWGGNPQARNRLAQLESSLTAGQLTEAKQRASTWIRRHTAPANNAAQAVPPGPQ